MEGIVGWFALVIITILVINSTLQYVVDRNWELIYTTFSDTDYFRIIGKLSGSGIPYKTKTALNLRNSEFFYDNHKQYDIYVKKQFVHKAHHTIHSNVEC
ncbi:hypothetical protein LCL95_00770 [Bacillus timonensis]|nr:hypothetical protein [Bacillus timonensis]